MPQSSSEGPRPPKPPEVGRRLQLKPLQLVGVSFLAVIVLLALFGVFGPTSGQAAAEGAVLDLEVRYPSRIRYKRTGVIEATVENGSNSTLERATVRFDRSYIDWFSSVQFTPSVTDLTDTAYEVTLNDLAPGEAKLVSVQLQAEEYWWRRGYIEVETGTGSTRVDFGTLNYP